MRHPHALIVSIVLLVVTVAASLVAQAAPVTCPPAGTVTPTPLPAGNGEDLEVTGPCTVGAGTYHYGNVNIYGGGSLMFEDAVIDFWALAILVENDGSLIAGTPEAPIGTLGGVVTLHLYGPDQGSGTGNGDGGQGILCQSPEDAATGPCGIPLQIWNSKGAAKVQLPGGAPDDYFYPYHPLPYDDGGAVPGFFGYKVLAVSYGGTLQLFGKKGATYGTVDAANSGASWVRLAQTLPAGGNTLVLDRPVDWTVGDGIVVTTTDYLPGHSEPLIIASVSPDRHMLTVEEPAQYLHNGEAYDLSALPPRLGLDFAQAETRAAVALLTRSIRIVSEGSAFGQPLPPTAAACAADKPGCQYFGGHTLVRQGVKTYQVQGVEFYQLGQGGRVGHYPIHFHLARKTPPTTFVQDASVHDSMTRWITLHGTHNVTLARNVGYLSIGHGYYLEDGTEINNTFSANLGIYARAAAELDAQTPQRDNPRQVPGILSASRGSCANAPNQTCTTDAQCGAGHTCVLPPSFPYQSDWVHPTVFWIMNGWNTFEGNMAAGAGACGACYWPVLGSISGDSRAMTWDSYASIQAGVSRGGTAPLKTFTGNYCTTAMHSLNSTPNTAVCLGVVSGGSQLLNQIANPLAPAPNPDVGQERYYPTVAVTLPQYTRCDGDTTDCSTVPICSDGQRDNCMVTVFDRYTTSFHWAETNFSAIWLRPRWFLVLNSVITDVQNAGLTFVTGGDYSHSSVITGNWMLARKNVFIGHTQAQNPLAANAGPFNPAGLACDNSATEAINYCLSRQEGISMPLSSFGVNQRLFNIYDGPSLQDSNAYLQINRTVIGDCPFPNLQQQCNDSQWMYGRVLGMPGAALGGTNACYLPNAAIAWKQPNGFYYPPAFHATNLFFDDVDIRHYVIEPLFLPETPGMWFKTDPQATQGRYCTWNPAAFDNFTAIDRQTILLDDDGSLTGLTQTASVNEDAFFNAPIETSECASDMTADTSPYDYVTTVVYPGCASTPNGCGANWNSNCTSGCYGVPLYRQYLTGPEAAQENPDTKIRMMGPDISGRINLTVNSGVYYLETTDGADAQQQAALKNIFTAGETYYIFLVYAKPSTGQTYQLYVGANNAATFDETNVSAVGVDLSTKTLGFQPITWPDGWSRSYDPTTGILSVTVDLQGFQEEFAAAQADRCQPQSFCTWNAQNLQCQCSAQLQSDNPAIYQECGEKNSRGEDAICSWAVNDIDCPTGGCLGFAVTLPPTFVADGIDRRPRAQCFPPNLDWLEPLVPASPPLAGACVNPPVNPPAFCTP